MALNKAGSDRAEFTSLTEMLDAVEVHAASLGDGRKRVQARTLVKMRAVCVELRHGRSVEESCERAGINPGTLSGWRRRYPPFGDFVGVLISANTDARKVAAETRRRSERRAQKLEVSRSGGDRRPRGGLAEFRMRYFGRPTPPHQELVVEALEDQTNLYVFVLGPPGMGKDTIAGDYAAWESAPDTSGQTVAWFMESSDFSVRRFGRLESYLIDPKSYDHAPPKTPGGAKPTGSLIEDYGPFKWTPDMVWDDGSDVVKKRWTQHAKYYVQVEAPQQDPNLWATGVDGATYGSRISKCVCSDIFTLENQRSPTERFGSYKWLTDTLDTRLDEDGRLVVIGTQLDIENNYDRLIEDYTADARVISEKRYQSGTLTKYSNGVCLVTIEAIWFDPETGEERSFWPERFPLEDRLEGKGKSYVVDEMSLERLQEVSARPYMRRVRGLRGRRQRAPTAFDAMYQQKRRKTTTGDFTDEILDGCRNPDRTFGQVYAHELRIVGVDPARKYGAAWVLWAVDRREKKLILADFFFGSDLGYEGIKQRLVVEPVTKWTPMWYCFESNKEGAILTDSLIQEVLEGTSVYDHHTGADRNTDDWGPAVLASYMRSHQIEIPYATAEDRARFELVKTHFKAWDRSVLATKRSKPGSPGHEPDDICMAGWIGSLKAVPLLDTSRRDFGVSMKMPNAVARRYGRAMSDLSSRVAERQASKGRRRVRAPGVTVVDALEEMYGPAGE